MIVPLNLSVQDGAGKVINAEVFQYIPYETCNQIIRDTARAVGNDYNAVVLFLSGALIAMTILFLAALYKNRKLKQQVTRGKQKNGRT